jgi:hypothetical protein
MKIPPVPLYLNAGLEPVRSLKFPNGCHNVFVAAPFRLRSDRHSSQVEAYGTIEPFTFFHPHTRSSPIEGERFSSCRTGSLGEFAIHFLSKGPWLVSQPPKTKIAFGLRLGSQFGA